MWTKLSPPTLYLIREQNSNLGDEDVSSCAIDFTVKLWTLYSSDNFVSLESIYAPVSDYYELSICGCILVRAGK